MIGQLRTPWTRASPSVTICAHRTASIVQRSSSSSEGVSLALYSAPSTLDFFLGRSSSLSWDSSPSASPSPSMPFFFHRPIFPAIPVTRIVRYNSQHTHKLAEEETLEGYKPHDYYPVYLGQIFKSQYQVITKLGFGTGSTVWLCRDLKYVPVSAASTIGNKKCC